MTIIIFLVVCIHKAGKYNMLTTADCAQSGHKTINNNYTKYCKCKIIIVIRNRTTSNVHGGYQGQPKNSFLFGLFVLVCVY